MKFFIEYTDLIEKKKLIYNIEECSFEIEPQDYEINYDIVINKINLTVAEDNNKVIQISGFCGYKEWIKAEYNVPLSKTGILKVLDELESGIGSYRINEKDLPVYVNLTTGWICIGNPVESKNSVEFITNCIAVIDDIGNLVSLWLKPLPLPDI